MMKERKQGLTLAEARRDLEETHRRLIAFIAGVPAEQLRGETPFRRRLRLDTYSHYPKHADTIRRWRKKESIPERAP